MPILTYGTKGLILLHQFDFHKREGNKHYLTVLVFWVRQEFEHYVEDSNKVVA